eukprot:TRINITY_DN8664_c0_g1_i5.p1 TRINITY_DN8664_c0_g1~~TRINITY_DN8664_c0_g1_i5.p1  ORF type:complete len:109 (+),score=15.88 TRINITY_DN8664_c0_g1_i5:163-489(+)
MLTSKKQFTPMNDIELAKAYFLPATHRVQRQGIEHYLDIDFSELNAIQGAEEARNRWIQLTKMTGLSVVDNQVAVASTVIEMLSKPNAVQEVEEQPESIIQFYKANYQ